MTVLIQLLETCNFNRSELGRRLGLSRQTAAECVKKRNIEPEHWDNVVKMLPNVTIEDCYDEFVRKRKQKQQRITN